MDTARPSSVSAAITISALTLLIAGCATSPGPRPETSSSSAGIVGTWTSPGALVDTSTSIGEIPYLDFDANGTWSASDGCNSVAGTWMILGKSFVTTTGPHATMECNGAALPKAASTATRIVLSFSRLILIDTDNSRTTLTRVTDKSVGPADLPTGYWAGSASPNAPFLALAANRTFTSSDGCNTLRGSWATGESGISLTFGPMTRMACDGVDLWLGDAVIAAIDSDTMTLKNQSGTTVGILHTIRSLNAQSPSVDENTPTPQ